MIERYVFVRLKPELATPEGRAQVVEKTRSALADVPGPRKITVGIPADEAATTAWDISIVVEFASVEDIEPYRVHPAHRSYVDDYLMPRTKVIKAWNFDVS